MGSKDSEEDVFGRYPRYLRMWLVIFLVMFFTRLCIEILFMPQIVSRDMSNSAVRSEKTYSHTIARRGPFDRRLQVSLGDKVILVVRDAVFWVMMTAVVGACIDTVSRYTKNPHRQPRSSD